MSGLFSTC